MGPEHIGYEVEQTPFVKRPEQRNGDLQSERPSDMELPHLGDTGDSTSEPVERREEDAERESMELPYLETEADKAEPISYAAENVSPDSDVTDNSENTNERQDAEDDYYSSYEERIKQTPREDSDRGEWSGERGESDYTPDDEEIEEILHTYGKENVTYKDGIPDFSDLSESTVEIDNMTENRVDNFRQCDEKCAEKWNKEARDGRTDWTARDVKAWRQENGYSWHERNDMKTCDLVPTKVNEYFGHLGGVSECKKRDAAETGGDDFDE